MDFDFTPQEEAFRREVRDWLRDNMKELPEWYGRIDIAGPEVDSDEYNEFSLWWHQKLYQAGFVGIAWPKEHGGRGATLIEQMIFNEEMGRHRAPGPANVMGLGWVAGSLMAHGTEEQQRRFLPKILSAEEIWCTLYSEPEAGSDMASVKTRAVEDGDDFVVNGQKVWTSGGHRADWAVLLARTDPDAPKHRGLSYLLVNMRSPGITVRPLRQITGHAGFNETFLDDVRIPKSQILGEKNRGWYVAAGALEYERLVGSSVTRENTIRDLVKMIKGVERNGQLLTQDPAIRQKLAQLYIEASILRYIGLSSIAHRMREGRPGPETSVGHIFEVESGQRLQDFTMGLQGMHAQLVRDSKYAIEHGRWQQSFLGARGMSIAGGTTEVLRNVIGQRVLGLPRSY